MHHHRNNHPPVLAALIIIRTRPEYERRSIISSLALFTVTITGRREAAFDLLHARFDPTDTRADIISGLCERVPEGAQLLVRQPILPARRLMDIAGRRDLPPIDNQLIARALPGTTLLSLTVADEQLNGAGEAMGLEMAGPESTPLKRNRRAPEQAMALWSVYTQAFCRKPEARALIASFQAWRVLERSKPLPF
ncbi:hypothetical protein SOQ14_09605 [Erythrobacter sp. T5W1-R]|uniref:hypothetical protein n=1 Tax=Erythrobacter sp. T5W1-R TaxID=3101752 RepID=UPI002AFE5641|nr:hypothetical protein [Erythrobacter sp. T5W1-R]MEA1619174.1 hypothetical protein [Erythrobacter sp. T5W1-R]